MFKIKEFQPTITTEACLYKARGVKVATINPELYSFFYKDDLIEDFGSRFETTLDSKVMQVFLYLFKKKKYSVITGSDFIESSVSYASEKNKSVLLIGARKLSNSQAVKKMKVNYPGVKIIGCSPKIDEGGFVVLDDGLFEVLKENSFNFVFVSFGAPKQELFIDKYHQYIISDETNFIMGVGGAIDFLSGFQKRAPCWIRKCCLEWLWRTLTMKGHWRRLGRVINAFFY